MPLKRRSSDQLPMAVARNALKSSKSSRAVKSSGDMLSLEDSEHVPPPTQADIGEWLAVLEAALSEVSRSNPLRSTSEEIEAQSSLSALLAYSTSHSGSNVTLSSALCLLKKCWQSPPSYLSEMRRLCLQVMELSLALLWPARSLGVLAVLALAHLLRFIRRLLPDLLATIKQRFELRFTEALSIFGVMDPRECGLVCEVDTGAAYLLS
jgi:hypothetical protein